METFVVLERQDSERKALSFTCPTAAVQRPGRPALIVQREQIEFLRELHFPWVKIARILGISESTLRRRRCELQLSDDDDQNFSELSGSYLSYYVVCLYDNVWCNIIEPIYEERNISARNITIYL